VLLADSVKSRSVLCCETSRTAAAEAEAEAEAAVVAAWATFVVSQLHQQPYNHLIDRKHRDYMYMYISINIMCIYIYQYRFIQYHFMLYYTRL